MKKHLKRLYPLLGVFFVVCSTYLIYSSFIVPDGADRISNPLDRVGSITSGVFSKILLDLNNITTDSEEDLFKQKLEEAQGINEDVVGWIQSDEFKIDYPVLFSDDNKKYLRTNIYGERDLSGCIYLDSRCRDVFDPIKLVHGHNMKNGTMFANLPDMFWWDSLDNAPLIYYYDELGLKTLKIFSIFSLNSEEESLSVGDYYTLGDLSYTQQYYANRSSVSCSEIPESLEMLLLNTCWYGLSGKERHLHCIVVAGRIN